MSATNYKGKELTTCQVPAAVEPALSIASARTLPQPYFWAKVAVPKPADVGLVLSNLLRCKQTESMLDCLQMGEVAKQFVEVGT